MIATEELCFAERGWRRRRRRREFISRAHRVVLSFSLLLFFLSLSLAHVLERGSERNASIAAVARSFARTIYHLLISLWKEKKRSRVLHQTRCFPLELVAIETKKKNSLSLFLFLNAELTRFDQQLPCAIKYAIDDQY